MLGKLLKHEFRQTSRTLLPLFIGTTVALFLEKMMMILSVKFQKVTTAGAVTEITQNPVFSILSSITTFLVVLLLSALMIGTLFMVVQRFYRMLGDEGYTIFALPVTPAQHIWAKTISGVTWTVAAAVYLFISVLFLLFTWVAPNHILYAANFKLWDVGAGQGLLLILMVLCIITGIVASQWLAYLACTVGAQFGHHRLVASIGAFFVIQTILQILGTVALVFLASGSGKPSFWNTWQNTSPLYATNIIFAVALGVLVFFCAIFYALIHHNLKKKLNLS